MKTVTLQIGNTDSKLSQMEYSNFVEQVNKVVSTYASETHFSGGSASWKPWVNYCWVFNIEDNLVDKIKYSLKIVRKQYRQDSVAWTVGETEFV